MEAKTAVKLAGVFLVSAYIGFYLGFTVDSSEQKYVSGVNATVGKSQDLATAEFNGEKIDLMYENTRKAKFYIDLDRDGSFEIKLDGLTRNAKVQQTTETVNIGDTNYRLYFRYSDDPGKKGDAWLEMYRVQES